MNKKIFNYWYSLLKHFFKLVNSTYKINNIIIDEKNIKLIFTLPKYGTVFLNFLLCYLVNSAFLRCNLQHL